MKRNLIYFTTGCDATYFKLTSFCIQTIAQSNNLENIDILVMCDQAYCALIRQDLPEFVKVHITADNSSSHQTSMRKCEIFNYEYIHMYDKILYLDSDIVVTGNIASLFDAALNDNILYVKRDSIDNDCHNHLEHSLRLYTETQVNDFALNHQHGFSCGHFIFCNSQVMKYHFDQVLKLMASHKGPYFYEQSFMNHYFNSNYATDETLLEGVVDFFDSGKLSDQLKNTQARIVHFANAQMPHMMKLKNMKIHIFSKTMHQVHDTRQDLAEILEVPSNPNIMEIGVFDAGFSKVLLKTFKPNMLYLVDPFQGDISSGDQDGNDVRTFKGDQLYKDVCTLFRDDRNVSILKTFSKEMSMLTDSSLDLVYLDGDHSYEGCKSDLAMAFDKVKQNGWICGHDFMMNHAKTSNVYDFGVKSAVMEFCIEHGLHINHVFMDGCVSFAIRLFKL